jgi:hypothetical protein
LLRPAQQELSRHWPTAATGRWRTLHHTTASPSKISDITNAALVLTHLEPGGRIA